MSPEELRYLEWLEDELPTILEEELPPVTLDNLLEQEPQPGKEPVRVWLGRLGIMWGLIAASVLIALLAIVGLVSVVMALARYVGGML